MSNIKVEASPESLRRVAELRLAIANQEETRRERIAFEYLHDPAKWTSERLGEQLWSKQVEIMQSVVQHRRSAVQSCHGVGKSSDCRSPDRLVD